MNLRIIRVFLGLSFSSWQINELENQISVLKRSVHKVRWTTPQNIHLTLHFFGNVSVDCLPEIKKIAAEVSRTTQGFELLLCGLGCFPETTAARILWAGVKGQVRSLMDFQGTLTDGLKNNGFAVEERPFVPHITLARAEKSRRIEFLEEFEKLEPVILTAGALIDHMVLFQSCTKPDGIHYEKIEKFPFTSQR